MYIYYNDKEGKRVRIKYFTNVSDMFHWCNMNCRCIKGNYYINGSRVMCEFKMKERGK
jgi:hypothetical protein